jgi:AraC-like DNA-binding protein
LIFDDREVVLSPGTFALWDSTRPMKFITGADLHQLTLTIPHERLHRDFPDAGKFIGKQISAKEGLNHLFTEHLLSLDEHFGDLTRESAPQILDATIDLLSATLGAGVPLHERGLSKPILMRIQAYIERHLHDPELCITKIASENWITTRHLHRLFEATEVSVGQWILSRRLDRCKSDFASAAYKHLSITEIAHQRGFADSSTFSKVFRREIGISPREFRASCLSSSDPKYDLSATKSASVLIGN